MVVLAVCSVALLAVQCRHFLWLELLPISNRDVTEAIQWIKEKEPLLSSEDYGQDLVSSEALFHSHKGLERNLAVMNDKVSHCQRNDWPLELEEAFGGYLA